MTTKGRLFGLGVGPGDPELVTLKTLRHLEAAHAVAYFAAEGRVGNAFTTVRDRLHDDQVQIRLQYPLTTQATTGPESYDELMIRFYEESSTEIRRHLDAGRDVAVICEGDPMLYGSYMYIHDRLADDYPTVVVPGVCAMLAGTAMLGAPLVYRDQSLTVLSGTLPRDELAERMAHADAIVVMKLGRNLAKVREVLASLNLLDRALYIERATMPGQRVIPVAEVDPADSPYFSLLVVPGRRWLT